MHLFRRAALRATASSSSSFIAAPRAITASRFLLRQMDQRIVSPPVFRQFSDNATDATEAAEEAKAQSFTDEQPSRPEDVEYSVPSSKYNRGEYKPGQRPSIHRVLEPSTGVYVGNLLFDITASDLEKIFEPFGTVKSAIVASDARGLSKGFGYVDFETIEQATDAIRARDQTVHEGRRMVVNFMTKTSTAFKTNPPSKTLFIGNIPFEMSDADLNKLFRDIRNVLDVRVAIDRRTGQPRGFAHADFVDIESAAKGKEALTGKDVYGRKLRVDFSGGRPRSRDPASSDPSEPSEPGF